MDDLLMNPTYGENANPVENIDILYHGDVTTMCFGFYDPLNPRMIRSTECGGCRYPINNHHFEPPA